MTSYFLVCTKMANKTQTTLMGMWKIPQPSQPSEKSEVQSAAAVGETGDSKKKISVKRFQNVWYSQFTWLRFDEEKKMMHCLTCEEACSNKSSAFVKGTNNYQKSALLRHESSDEHLLAIQTIKEKSYMKAAKKCVDTKLEPILEAQLRTALWLAKENVADRKFLSLIDLQIANSHLLGSTGSVAGQTTTERPKGIQTSHQTASQMEGYLASVIKDMMIVKLQNSPFIGIMVDESLDIATKKKLVIFARIIHDGSIKNEFCANIEVQDGKAETIYNSIMEFLCSVGISSNKISGFGTDGANVMTGRRSGVGIRLQGNNPRIIHVWCAAHRVALVSFWAAKKVPYLQQVQRTLVNIYNFYEFSAPRYNKLRELCLIMGKQVKKFKKPTQVRWLSLQDAVLAVYAGWSSLVQALEHECASNPQSEGGVKAKGLLKEVKSFKFISAICLLKDVLENLCSLSKSFQKDVVDIEQVTALTDSSKETLSHFQHIGNDPPSVSDLVNWLEEENQFQGVNLSCSLRDRLVFGNMKKKFILNIVEEFNNRFSVNDMSILKQLNVVLNPKLLPENRTEVADYGTESLESICNFFRDIIDTERTQRSFLQFKFFARQYRNKSLIEFCVIVATQYCDQFPDFCSLAAILATVPLTSVPCERGFSVQNRHADRFTNRRGVRQVENRMLISYAAAQDTFDENRVINQALAKMQQNRG